MIIYKDKLGTRCPHGVTISQSRHRVGTRSPMDNVMVIGSYLCGGCEYCRKCTVIGRLVHCIFDEFSQPNIVVSPLL